MFIVLNGTKSLIEKGFGFLRGLDRLIIRYHPRSHSKNAFPSSHALNHPSGRFRPSKPAYTWPAFSDVKISKITETWLSFYKTWPAGPEKRGFGA